MKIWIDRYMSEYTHTDTYVRKLSLRPYAVSEFKSVYTFGNRKEFSKYLCIKLYAMFFLEMRTEQRKHRKRWERRMCQNVCNHKEQAVFRFSHPAVLDGDASGKQRKASPEGGSSPSLGLCKRSLTGAWGIRPANRYFQTYKPTTRVVSRMDSSFPIALNK